YDAQGQLAAAHHTNSPTNQPDENYSYDANGNRTLTSYSTGQDNHLTTDGTYNYSYDAEGNRTSRVSIATGAMTVYSYDWRNRLETAVDYVPSIDPNAGQGTDWGWGPSDVSHRPADGAGWRSAWGWGSTSGSTQTSDYGNPL